MPRVWSDGREIVVARSIGEVPSMLDRHYGVAGHTLRSAAWVEMTEGTVLSVAGPSGSHERVPAWALAEAGSGWVGRVA
jgi:hypothetical protein